MNLLDLYDSQLRTKSAKADDWDGPVFRQVYGQGGFIGYSDVSGVPDLGALIARQRDYFAERGISPVEWKYHSHDLPADLPELLRAAGFEPEDEETVLIGLAEPLAELTPAVVVEATADPADFDEIAAFKTVVWDKDMSWVPGWLRELTDRGDEVFVARIDNRIVSAAWICYETGTEFAGLWGGSTLAEYRGRGVYKALVAARARNAVARGYKYLQVDASEDSRPILQRLGFEAVTKTTPYVWNAKARG